MNVEVKVRLRDIDEVGVIVGVAEGEDEGVEEGEVEGVELWVKVCVYDRVDSEVMVELWDRVLTTLLERVCDIVDVRDGDKDRLRVADVVNVGTKVMVEVCDTDDVIVGEIVAIAVMVGMVVGVFVSVLVPEGVPVLEDVRLTVGVGV